MNDSTRRSLRTAYQALIAAITTIPLLIAGLSAIAPEGSDLAVAFASIVAGVAIVTKVLNALEDAKLIPAWLKGESKAPELEPEPAPEPEPLPADEPIEGPVE